jgi:hypothetical protein
MDKIENNDERHSVSRRLLFQELQLFLVTVNYSTHCFS